MGSVRPLALCAALAVLCGCSTAAVPVDGFAPVPEETKYIALTFDDGPSRETTERLLDGLQERGASATFFVIGEEIAGNEDLLTRMRQEGHQVGNHTWSHVRLEDPGSGTQEIGQTEQALRSVLEQEGFWIRPPYGVVGEGMTVDVPMVKWSVDPRDWEKRNTAQVVQAVLKDVRPNDIILLHDIYPTSVDAALQIVDALQAEGYWFVTVEELLRLNGIEPQPGVLYRSGVG